MSHNNITTEKNFYLPVKKIKVSDISNYDAASNVECVILINDQLIVHFCSKTYNLVSNQDFFLPIKELIEQICGNNCNVFYKKQDESKFYFNVR